MTRPLIAIPSRFSATASALRYRAEVGSRDLISAVYAAGGEPLLVHPASGEPPRERLAWADGVLLPGGGDLAPRWAGQPGHEALYDVDEEQDAFDLAVARHALGSGLPLLAVCRGLQVVNVALGGTLVLDMDSAGSNSGRSGSGGDLRQHRHRVHEVRTVAGTRTAELLGPRVTASCYHHQCVDRIGSGLMVTATAEDGVIEAVELAEPPAGTGWFFGVQWHPEDNWGDQPGQSAIFRAFVGACSGDNPPL
ncbi:MAG: gamma-glutamyl-gamma-aminobutyrate hydrolase family protein [Nocardioides sp.]